MGARIAIVVLAVTAFGAGFFGGDAERTADARARFLADDASIVAALAAACDPRARYGPEDDWPRTACVLLQAFAADDLPTWRSASAVEAALQDPDAGVRARAARHLAPLGIVLGDERFARLLDDPSPAVVAAALRARVDLGDRGVRDEALRRLRSPSPEVRVAAADALLDPADPSSVDDALPAVDDPNAEVRTGIRTCADRLGLLDVLLVARLDHGARAPAAAERAATWRSVAFLLEGRPLPGDLFDRLADAARDPAEEVRVEAALAARSNAGAETATVGEAPTQGGTGGRVGRWSLAPGAVSAVLDDPEPGRRRAAVELTTWLSKDDARRVVRDRLARGESDDDVAAALLTRIGEVGTAEDIATVIAFGDAASSARLEAAAVLAAARLDAGRGDPRVVGQVRSLLAEGDASSGALATAGDAARIVGDPALLPDVAAALRRCPIERPWACATLPAAVSVLLGRRLHGDAFDLGGPP